MAGKIPSRKFRVEAPKKPSLIRKWCRRLTLLGIVGGFLGAGIGVVVYFHYLPTVPQFESIEDYQPKLGTRIYSLDNQLIGEFAEERRVLVPLSRVPKLLPLAFIAAEDKRFYSHIGLDFIGLSKAVLDKVMNPGKKLRGASTITQQVAKSILVSVEGYASATQRSLERKIREAILARRLESNLSKDEIIYMYMNQIFLGHRAYGVQAAAEHYYQKNVEDMSLAEMATLAGLPQRPSDYSPFSRPEAAKARRSYVLRRMLAEEFITQEEFEAAFVEEVKVYSRRELYLEKAPYFTEHVRRILVDRYGERAVLGDGFQVYTSMDIEFQNYAQKAVQKGLKDLDKRQGFRGPLGNLPTKKLRSEFIERYREELGLDQGELPDFSDRDSWVGLVSKFEQKGRLVSLNIGGKKGLLPLAGMRWARKPNPVERWEYHYLRDARRGVKIGDLVEVVPTTRARLARDPHGWEIVQQVPRKGDLFALEQEPIANAALMSVDPKTGYVKAQVGGYHFETSSFNRAIQACREPGSAFKPVVYSAAIDKLDFTPSTLIDDKPLIFDDARNAMRWKPKNAGEKFRGRLPMRTCLKDSINTPAIRLAQAVGIRDIIRNARRFGITTDLKSELGTALGSSCTTLNDLIKVYVALNQMGQRRDLIFVRRVIDRFGNVLEENSASSDPTAHFGTQLDRAYHELTKPTQRVLDPPSAYVMVSLLQNVVQSGTAMSAQALGIPTAGKTGTTNDSYDAWFMGFTEPLVTGVWVGHDQKERPLGMGETGGRTALPVWLSFMDKALRDYGGKRSKRLEVGEFSPPDGVVRVAIDPDTGLLARPGAVRVVDEYYRSGTQPTEFSPDENFLDPDSIDLYGADAPL